MFEMSQTSISQQQLIVSTTNKIENTTANGTKTLSEKLIGNSKQIVEQNNITGSSTLPITMGSFGPSPLDQLIKFHARLHDEELAYSTTSSSLPNSSTLSQLKDSSSIFQPQIKAEESLDASTLLVPLSNYQQQFGSNPFDPSSPSALMFSSYAQLAAATPWTSWSGEMAAAFLSGGEAEGILNNSPTSFSRGGWSGGDSYLNALGAFAPPTQTSFANNIFLPQAIGEPSTQSYQPFPASSIADLKTLATTSRALMQQSNDATKYDLKSEDGIFFPNMVKLFAIKITLISTQNNHQLQQNQTTSSSRASLISKYVQQKRSNTNNNQQQNKNKAGGKIRINIKSKNNDCVCPDCMELQRTGKFLHIMLLQYVHLFLCTTRRKPKTQLSFSWFRSSHLKAHLRWHSTDRPPTTKKRLFDPPDGPPPPQPISIAKSLNIKAQIKQTIQQSGGGHNSSSSTE
ncbi:C2H2-type domain-containing protein [Meloidogyne graminicola]|uniref:C2H2-type domain-containing protein n=1 Tax=Meloidogyne graminicola TaxID=189291 RepID=A0A8T0A211_9BILA|nr:C2H2-type domain-containing protein [Meloidogyne graminicola]